MKTRIYIASKTKHAPKWKALRNQDVNIISTWIDEAGAGESKSLSDLAKRCITEAANCDLFILYAEEDEILKGALVELGAALLAGVRVVSVGNGLRESSAFTHHPLYTSVPNLGVVLPCASCGHRLIDHEHSEDGCSQCYECRCVEFSPMEANQ